MNFQSSNRPFCPSFIKKIDRKLLLRYPETWSSRFHIVWWYAGMANLIIAAFYLLTNLDLLQQPSQVTWISMLSISSLIGGVVWMMYLLRFNVFKRFGMVSPGQSVLTFLLYFVNCAFIVLLPFIPTFVDQIHSAITYPKNVVVQDVNEINTYLTAIESDRIPTYWEEDTVILFNTETFKDVDVADAFTILDDDVSTYFVGEAEIFSEAQNKRIYYPKMNSQYAQKFIERGDSVIKISDKLYVFIQTPNLNFCTSSYGAIDGQWPSSKIYKEARKWSGKSKIKPKYRLNTLLNKYRTQDKSLFAPEQYDKIDVYVEDIGLKYDLVTVQSGLNNLMRRNGSLLYSQQIPLFNIFYSLTLTLALLVFIFRHTTKKAFFLSLLYAFILFAVTGILIQLLLIKLGIDNSAYSVIFFIILCVILLTQSKRLYRSTNYGTVLNMFVVMLMSYPTLLSRFLLDLNMVANMEEGNPTIIQIVPISASFSTNLLTVVQYIQLPFFMICIYFFIHDLYKKWYALPEA